MSFRRKMAAHLAKQLLSMTQELATTRRKRIACFTIGRIGRHAASLAMVARSIVSANSIHQLMVAHAQATF
jgi:hypothetical protein